MFCACGPGCSVGIVTDYGLDGPGSNPGGDEIFRPSRPALAPTQPPVQWVPGLSWGGGVKCGRGVLLTTDPLLLPWSWKSRGIPLHTLWATPGLSRDHFTFKFCTCNYPRRPIFFLRHTRTSMCVAWHRTIGNGGSVLVSAVLY